MFEQMPAKSGRRWIRLIINHNKFNDREFYGLLFCGIQTPFIFATPLMR